MKFGFAPARAWERVRHLLLPAIVRDGDWNEAEVIAALTGGAAQLWIGEDDRVFCAVVTCLSRTARGLTCEIWLMGGEERRRWLHLLRRIEDAARERGCVSIEFTGRKGWARVLPDYHQQAIMFRKALHDGKQEKEDQGRALGAGPAPYHQGDGADERGVRREPAATAGDVGPGL